MRGVVDRRTACYDRNTRTPRRAGVAVRGVAGALLVRRRNSSDAVTRQGVEHRQVVGTRNAEHDVDVVQRQRRDDDLASGDTGEPIATRRAEASHHERASENP